ncbi:hypothetical protein CO087_01045 [Candidatus Wolfebacteria bacterium CG_4_9_14_0_8_um_filter_39_46]|uniref:Uncharacterized protein n=1 Tax=Candidatus Wolfebacteria bacterium CG_4_9_14_0_8_um_filter_39_46 TaxID=1975064 RepID=A0A2M8D9C5_9BACT|nr:MAG: hypothetical protein CO087_01045 [Candidatus Wolfebacteria bacterium CG_4_9_14_0_8_um_filter_39_46]
MRNDKHLAIKLRKKGLSYNKISKELDIPKSTLSDWLCDIGWSLDIKKELIRKANYITRKRLRLYNKKRQRYWEQWREAARQEARKDFDSFKNNPLFVSGLMLYWAEGDSNPKNSLRLSNTDPRMIFLYAKFLMQVLNIPKEKLRATLILYPDLAKEKCIKFWSRIIGITKSQFYKTQYIKGFHPTKRLSNGICMIIYSDRQLKEKVLVWIDLLSKTL